MPTGLVHIPFYYFPIVADWNGVMSGHIHTPVGPAHYTSGAPICSEIPSTLAWGRKVPSIRSVPRGGSARVLFMERLCTSKRDLLTLLPFDSRYRLGQFSMKCKVVGIFGEKSVNIHFYII